MNEWTLRPTPAGPWIQQNGVQSIRVVRGQAYSVQDNRKVIGLIVGAYAVVESALRPNHRPSFQ
jgi:hypothetical protein